MKRWISAGLAMGIWAGLLAVISFGVTPVAEAAGGGSSIGPGRPTEPGFVGYVTARGEQLGIARLKDGTYGVCIDASKAWPSGTPSSKAVTNPKVGYVLSKYMTPARKDPRLAAAVWWVVGKDLKLQTNQPAVRSRIDRMRRESPKQYAAIKKWRDRLISDVQLHAPTSKGYRPALKLSIGKRADRGTATQIGVRSASGRWVAGYPVRVTVSGARFAGGKTTWSGKTSSTPRALTWSRTSPSTVTVTQRVEGLPSQTYRFHRPSSKKVQRVVASAGTVKVSDKATVATPWGHARVRKTAAHNGAALSGATFTAWADLDGNKRLSAGEPSAAVTSGADGWTPTFRTYRGTSACFLETKAPAGYEVNPTPSCVQAGSVDKTAAGAAVVDKLIVWQPTLTTRINKQKATVGATLVDSVFVKNTHGANVTGRWQLVGPVAPTSASKCPGPGARPWSTAPMAASGSFTVRGDGTYKVGSHRISEGGCYTYSESLKPTLTTKPVGWTTRGIVVESSLVAPRTPAVPRNPLVPAGGAFAARKSAPAGPTLGYGKVGLPKVRLSFVKFRGRTLMPPSNLRTAGVWKHGAALDAVVGTTVIVGHVSDDRDRPGAFKKLHRARRGQIFTTRAGGEVQKWRVTSILTVAKSRLSRSLFTQKVARRLVLITCTGRVNSGGGFHYTKNLIITATPIR